MTISLLGWAATAVFAGSYFFRQLGPAKVDTTIVVFRHLSFRVAKKHPMS